MRSNRNVYIIGAIAVVVVLLALWLLAANDASEAMDEATTEAPAAD